MGRGAAERAGNDRAVSDREPDGRRGHLFGRYAREGCFAAVLLARSLEPWFRCKPLRTLRCLGPGADGEDGPRMRVSIESRVPRIAERSPRERLDTGLFVLIPSRRSASWSCDVTPTPVFSPCTCQSLTASRLSAPPAVPSAGTLRHGFEAEARGLLASKPRCLLASVGALSTHGIGGLTLLYFRGSGPCA